MLECSVLLILSANIYGRLLWQAFAGQTINPGVMLIAGPLCLVTYLWVKEYQLSSQRDDLSQDYVNKEGNDSLLKNSEELILGSWYLSVTSLCILLVASFFSWEAYTDQALKSNHYALWQQEWALIFEGLGLLGLWSAWTWRKYGANIENVVTLHYPLSIGIFGLPWEGILRHYDYLLQKLSTDLAVFFLDGWSIFFSPQERPLNIEYWDAITIYSPHFYLIINETCAGVNLLLSMSLYAFGFAWVMNTGLQRAWILVLYIIPLCLVFNGIRIAIIFALGHFGDQELATGFWHEGTAYLTQAILFIILAFINYLLDQEPKSAKHDPSMLKA